MANPDLWIYLTIVPMGLAIPLFFLIRHIYIEYVRPNRYYKLVIFDETDEFTFYMEKKKAEVNGDKKGFNVQFGKNKDEKEFYNVSTTNDDLPSKRDDKGTVTFYYWRNNANPLKLKINEPIVIDNDASLLYTIANTNIFNSALMEEEGKKPILPLWVWILLGVLVLALLLFWDKIKAALA